MDGVGGYAGWRWIFILEGILTVIVALIAFFTIYDFPETASFLTEREREFVIYRLRYQGSSAGAKKIAQHEGYDLKYIKAAFTDWQVYVSLISMISVQKGGHLIANRFQCTGVSSAHFMAFPSSCQPSSKILDIHLQPLSS